MKYLGTELKKFSAQIQFALAHYQASGIDRRGVHNIVIAGLGGSGIAGRIVKNYFSDKIAIPVELVADYSLPAYVNSSSLVILCSYSGNTEETISCYHNAKSKGALRLAITTGGSLLELAKQDQIPYYLAEPGFQPRVALGYSLTYLMCIFSEFTNLKVVEALNSVIAELSQPITSINSATAIVNEMNPDLANKFIIITDNKLEAIALRFSQQIQENAKLEAFVNIIPEANHNVIESYYGKINSNFILMMDFEDKARNSLRFKFLADHLIAGGNKVIQIDSKSSTLNNIFQLIYLLDWISLIIADKVAAVSNKVNNITLLKAYLDNNKK